jgi:hypothetical protein
LGQEKKGRRRKRQSKRAKQVESLETISPMEFKTLENAVKKCVARFLEVIERLCKK